MATNMAPQGILPPAVAQIATVQQLGPFTQTYKTTLANTIGSIIVLIVVGGFFGVLIVLGGFNIVTIVIMLAFMLLFIGAAIYTGYNAIQVANQQIYLFQHGIVIENKNQIQALPWNQASEVWQSITRHYRNGAYTGTTYMYTLRRADGYQVKLDNLTKNIAELGQAVAKGITQELVPRALYSVHTGQTLTFTPFSLNLQGIGNGKEFIPWAQVQAVDVNKGSVIVKKIGKRSAWKEAPVAKIPNFFVFTILAEEMLRQTRSVK